MATSGSRGTVELALARIGYSDWFSPFVCADDLHHAKPHPEAFLTVLERAGVKPGQALVFEDSHSGFAAAAAAGIACVDARSNLWDQLHGFAA
jgi:sugar-phosphatase